MIRLRADYFTRVISASVEQTARLIFHPRREHHRGGRRVQGVAGWRDGFHAVPKGRILDRRATVREHARSRFGFQQMVDEYLALYRSLLKPARPGK